MSTKGKRMSKEERRTQIIESAMNLFVKNGYHATTTASIAEEAGISEVTLFRYFSSKEELFSAGLEPILVGSLEHSIDQAKDLEPIEQLRFIIKERIVFASENHQVLKLILMESQLNPEVIGFDYIEKVLTLLKKSIQETGIVIENKETMNRLLMGSILSFLYFPQTKGAEIDQYVDELVEILTK